MPSLFMLDPDYRGFVPGQTRLRFTTLYRGGHLDFAIVMVYCICAVLLLVFSLWAVWTMGEVNALTVVLLCVSFGLIYLLRWGWHESRRYWWAIRAYPLLHAQGILLEGDMTRLQRRVVSARNAPSQHLIDIAYTFTTPDGHVLTGQQSNQREDLRNARLPVVGTPVHVLWAGDVWIVL